MLNIGLTGGIGSGKSTVAGFLRELGAPIIDADKVGHEVYLPGTAAHREVVAAFGTAILAPDGSIDRQKLGAIVFADPAALSRLERIVHPRIFERVLQRIAQLRAQGVTIPVVVEAAVLLEAHWNGALDEVWLVVAPREQVMARLEAQRGLRPEQIAARIRAQMPEAQRRQAATLVIENDGSLPQLRARVGVLWGELLARAHSR